MEEIGRLLECAEILPAPTLTTSFCLQVDALVVHIESKCILEGSGAFVDAEGKEAPDGYPEQEPDNGENKKGKSLYSLEIEQYSRNYRKNVDRYEQEPDLRSAKEMTPQSIQHLFLVVTKLNSHSAMCSVIVINMSWAPGP